MSGKVLAASAVFVVGDLGRAIEFYCGKLGFVDPATWGEPPSFAIINRDEFELMLSCDGSASEPSGGAWDLYIRVDDVAAARAGLVAGGVDIVRGPERTDAGTLEIELRDPDGYRIRIGQEIGASA